MIKKTSRVSKIIASVNPSCPSKHMTYRATVAPTINGNSRRKRPRGTFNGNTKAETPRIKPIFATLDPTILPTAIADEPFPTANKDTINSGILVANDTIVIPIISGRIPNERAKRELPSTKKSAP